MAGSGFPPLPNIPYCCLPQESGPCLSTSVGDRPLRSPSHRRLGGPSPRQLSNGTHARPRPPEGFRRMRMPSLGRMGHHPAFPPAVPPSGVGCIRVTHPSATLNPPKGILPFDLHVLGLPLAFILSQDQTLRCTIVFCFCFSLNLGFRLDVLLCSLFKGSLPRAASPRRWSCAGLRLSKNLRLPSLPASLLPKAGAKVQPFSLSTIVFRKNFSSTIYIVDYQVKNFS